MLALALLLAGCGDSGDKVSQPPRAGTWQIGPVIGGKNYSQGPTSFDTSFDVVEPHYVTKRGSLVGKQSISLSFTVDAPLMGKGCGQGTVSAYFQAAGDDWSTDGKRWWFGTVTVDHAGEYRIDAPLDANWTSVQSMTAATHPQEFAAAKASASRVGFTFGNCEGLGHGVVGPARFTLTSFLIS